AKARSNGIATRMCKDSALLPERLATLPLTLFDWPADILTTLQTLGVRTIGQCLQLPRAGFNRRFGHAYQLDLDKALGSAADPRLWFTPPDTYASRIEFGFELNDAMMLLFPLKRLLQELEGFLRARGAGVQQWQLLLEHMNHGRTTLVIGVATPERSADRFLTLAREKLTQMQMSAPILALGIAADKLLEFDESNRSLIPDAKSRAIGWDHLIDKLVTRLSNDRVYRLRALDDHRPEHAWQPTEATMTKLPHTPKLQVPRPLWLLREPRSLSTEDGTPLCQGHLQFVAGPERIESGWWDGNSARRDYYIARNKKGETFWIYREHRRSKHWYLHGVFA
ncbi:MAG: DNA polymerase Y family protein, partial [Pseudomonadota bacterium]